METGAKHTCRAKGQNFWLLFGLEPGVPSRPWGSSAAKQMCLPVCQDHKEGIPDRDLGCHHQLENRNTVGWDNLRGLFQPEWFYDCSMKWGPIYIGLLFKNNVILTVVNSVSSREGFFCFLFIWLPISLVLKGVRMSVSVYFLVYPCLSVVLPPDC